MASQQNLQRHKVDGHVFRVTESAVHTSRGGHYRTWYSVDNKKVTAETWRRLLDEAMAREGRL